MKIPSCGHPPQQLQRDLGVNLAGAALALELLERIAELEAKVRSP